MALCPTHRYDLSITKDNVGEYLKNGLSDTDVLKVRARRPETCPMHSTRACHESRPSHRARCERPAPTSATGSVQGAGAGRMVVGLLLLTASVRLSGGEKQRRSYCSDAASANNFAEPLMRAA